MCCCKEHSIQHRYASASQFLTSFLECEDELENAVFVGVVVEHFSWEGGKIGVVKATTVGAEVKYSRRLYAVTLL
jgi:hypothetical protein